MKKNFFNIYELFSLLFLIIVILTSCQNLGGVQLSSNSEENSQENSTSISELLSSGLLSNEDVISSSNDYNQNDLIISDILIDFYDNEQPFFKDSILDFSLRIKFSDESLTKYVSYDDILFNYDEEIINIQLSSLSYLKSNEFTYVIYVNSEKNITFNVNINDFSKDFSFSCCNGLIDTSIYFTKNKMSTNVYNITPLYSLDEYEDFCDNIKLTSKLNPKEELFNDYFIVVVPVTRSSSTIENQYINCFVKEEQLYFNFTMLDNKNSLWDYYEDLFFIIVNNDYKNFNFNKIMTSL